VDGAEELWNFFDAESSDHVLSHPPRLKPPKNDFSSEALFFIFAFKHAVAVALWLILPLSENRIT